jgi:hypothetical protein
MRGQVPLMLIERGSMSNKHLNDITDDFENISREESQEEVEVYNKKTRSRSSAPVPNLDDEEMERRELVKKTKKEIKSVSKTSGTKTVIVESHLGTFRGTFYIDTGYYQTHITEKVPKELPISVINYLKNKTYVTRENDQPVRRRTFTIIDA